MDDAFVRLETHNSIATLEFYHPQGNSLPSRLLEDLAREIHSAGMDEDIRVLILKSAGDRSFCAGASFEELSSLKHEKEGTAFFSGFAHVINAMRKCPKLIIARVQGKCVGGGVGIAAAADYAIACEGADIRLSELSVGIGPFVVGPAVERKIGTAAFSHLAIDAGMWRNADWARRKGLYAELHPSATDMDESISRLANTLAHSNPDAMAEMKKIFWKGTESWDHLLIERAMISGRLVLGAFTKEAIAKFKMSRTESKATN